MQHATGSTLPITITTLGETGDQAGGGAHFRAMEFLARYSGSTRAAYGIRLRLWLEWCTQNHLDPIGGVTRGHIELYARHLEEIRNNKPSSVHGSLCVLRIFYRLLAADGVIPTSPAEYIRMPKVFEDDVARVGLSRLQFAAFVQTAKTMSPDHAALAVLLGLLGLRISEACSIQVADFAGHERDHRVLKIVGKGRKPATIPLPPPVFRELDACAAQGPREGQLLYRLDGVTPLDRHAAYRMVRQIGKRAGITRPVHPHLLRHSFVTAALDAGVALRDVQIAARHSDPRVTVRYDRARTSLDRHAVHTVSAFIAGGA